LSPDSLETDGIVTKQYYYFKESELDKNDIKPQDINYVKTESLNYSTFLPVYNTTGEKIRTVTAKESNYFNILQSIAETFEAWLSFDIKRNTENGAIEEKWVKFSNYVGDINYASFRYGVNLKDI
jgi:hypothetical protein